MDISDILKGIKFVIKGYCMTSSSSSDNTHVLKDIQDATPSWSGYNYQGKVALHLALSTLNNLNQRGLSIAEYTMEIEYLEDIAILKDRQYQSLHQVKSLKSAALSAYQDAIWILLSKSDTYAPTDGVYLHTSTQIKEPKMEEVMVLNASDNVKAIRDRVVNTIDVLFPSFQLFPYSSGNRYCSLHDIDCEINTQIITYLHVFGLNGYDVEKKRLKLLNIIHDHIMDRHTARQQTKKAVNESDATDDMSTVLSLSVFEKCLLENHEEPSDFYLLCELKEWFTDVCDEYISLLRENGETDLDNLLQAALLISSLSYDEFQLFCRRVNPHVNWTNLSLATFKKLFEKTSTRASLLLALQKVSKQLHQDQFTYESNDKFYLPTTIHGGSFDPYYDMLRKNTAREILLNTALDETIMEVNTFISSQMEMPSLHEVAMNTIGEADPDLDNRNHITRLGRINMITVSQALKEIK